MKIGIDVGGSHIGIALIKNDVDIIFKKDYNYTINEKIDNNFISNFIINSIKKTLEVNSLNITDITLVGIAFPGIVQNGIIIKSDNLNVYNLNLKDLLTKEFNVLVIIRNDAKCAALYEKKYGSLTQSTNSIFLTLGTGIGGAVFVNNTMLNYPTCNGFEVGHMVIHLNGKKCNCGRKGCFEKYASMKYLKENIKSYLNNHNLSGIEIKNIICRNTNPKIEKIINEYIDNLSIGIVNLINIFEPDTIAIGGSFSYYDDILLNKLIHNIKNNKTIFNTNLFPNIVLAKFKNEAGILGSIIK